MPEETTHGCLFPSFIATRRLTQKQLNVLWLLMLFFIPRLISFALVLLSFRQMNRYNSARHLETGDPICPPLVLGVPTLIVPQGNFHCGIFSKPQKMPRLQSLSVEVAKSAMVSPGDALAYMAPGGLDQDADVLRGYILGAPSLAVNFSTLVVTTVLMIRRLGELAGDPAGAPCRARCTC
jgi:hypothetical protein